MATKISQHHPLFRYALMFLSLLTLGGVLSGCGASSVAGPTQQVGSTTASTSTRVLKGSMSEIPLPAHFSPSDITAGSDGNLWMAGNLIGRITPQGIIREYSLPANSFAFRITTGPDGNLWFLQADTVGRITPSGTISEFPLPSRILAPDSCTPYTLCGGITSGPNHALWFTEPGTADQNGTIWRISTAGTISAFPLPDTQSHPTAITTGTDGNLWFVGFIGNNVPRGTIWRLTPKGTISAFATPGLFPSAITAGSDGNLWFTKIFKKKSRKTHSDR